MRAYVPGWFSWESRQSDLRNSGKERVASQSQAPIVRRKWFDTQEPWGFNGLAWFEIYFSAEFLLHFYNLIL